MSGSTIRTKAPGETFAADERESLSVWPAVQAALKPFASLRLTVGLFAMAIFIVLAGTLAQVEKDIWQVVDEYFRVKLWPTLGFAWIEFQIFFPPSFFPSRPQVPGGFYFPGGWLIGTVMAVNLLAAHSVRFKVQARGGRLAAGLGVLAFGVLVTWLVIASGSNADGFQATAWVEWSTLWTTLKIGLASGLAGVGYALWRLKSHQKIERGVLTAAGLVLAGLTVWLLSRGEAAQLDDSAMRILWQLIKGTAAGLVLLGGCWLLFRKRAGVVLLHGGVGLMMFSEVLVGTTAVETQMSLFEGETTNYARDVRALELAVVDPSDSQTDDVVVVPKSILLPGETIQHDDLPFDIKLDQFFQNSRLRKLELDEKSPATAGTGLKWTVDEARPGTGTDTGGKVDVSAAYVTFREKDSDKPLGTYLLSLEVGEANVPERVTVGGKTYDVALRFERAYKPYSVHLIDVRKDDYIGTSTVRNYSSDIRLVDESRNVDREVHIWMNNPLRYAGETFYQTSYSMSESGREITTLSVVTNTGWMIPYVACMIVAVGLLAHFSVVLLRFLNRRETMEVTATDVVPAQESKKDRRMRQKAEPVTTWGRYAPIFVPVVIVAALAGWLFGKTRVPTAATGEMNLYEFGQLPLVYEGRVKPFDTLGRNSLLIISDRQTFVDGEGQRQPAIRWLLDVVANRDVAEKHRVFRIENLELLSTLNLSRRKGFRYSLAEIKPRLEELEKQADLAHKTDSDELSAYQRKVVDLANKIQLLRLLEGSMQTPPVDEKDPELQRQQVLLFMQDFQRLMSFHPPLVIPPQETDEQTKPAETESAEEKTWDTYAFAWIRNLVLAKLTKSQPEDPHVASMSGMYAAYANGDTKTFNAELDRYKTLLAENRPERLDTEKVNFEAFFNHFEPFYHASVLYVVAFVLVCLSWLGWTRTLNRTSFWLIVFTLLVHTFAIASRIYISGRPPVTNLYSSAVFIGWGCVVLGLILEAVYRLGIGNVIASVAGFAALLIAHILAGDGDTFIVLQAVLDTQFWLATHVVCITLGYATTFVAGLLGILYIMRGVLTTSLSPQVGRDLTRMIYGTICFAIFFSFVGTVLGGLWADDSWGRFWGWDPKENGALIIVLWNALVLHARWGGLVKERGLAALAVAGNITTSWSWFGVNELGIGLHSYGFTEGVLLALGIFVMTQLAIIGLAMMPRRLWMSQRAGRLSDA